MKQFTQLFQKEGQLPKAHVVEKAIDSFSLTEKVIFWFFVGVFILSALGLLLKVNNEFLVEVPDKGGELKEGIIGSPRFINPLLAIGDADKDLVSLVYSGLMKAAPDGELVPDLAESYTVSPDRLTYTFILKENLRFHDGTAVTTDDVEFTVTKAQDPGLKSPKRASWDGVTIEKISEKEITFILKQPYAPFLGNTTLGILPKHIWKNANADEFAFSEYNTNPVGSGPYSVRSIGKNSAGIPNIYHLRSFGKYALGEAYIRDLTLRFYSNENDLLDAYAGGHVESMNGISAKAVALLEGKGVQAYQAILPRVFGVFFNQNQAQVFAEKAVRQALNVGLDKQAIVQEVLSGYGTVIDGPFPPKELNKENFVNEEEVFDRAAGARKILEDAGWKFSSTTNVMEKKTKASSQTLSFSISTSDTPELKSAVERIRDDWEKIGAKVDIQIFETGDLNQNIIRPRKYDALFFGEIIGRDLDMYPFWHSSQRNDPGLNIALYVNNKADKLLEEARETGDKLVRAEKYAAFEKEIANDMPVVFVYSPSFLYIAPEKVKGITLGQITIPGERFLNVKDWYIETNKVWKIFLD